MKQIVAAQAAPSCHTAPMEGGRQPFPAIQCTARPAAAPAPAGLASFTSKTAMAAACWAHEKMAHAERFISAELDRPNQTGRIDPLQST